MDQVRGKEVLEKAGRANGADSPCRSMTTPNKDIGTPAQSSKPPPKALQISS
jgi:hypothetical protein